MPVADFVLARPGHRSRWARPEVPICAAVSNTPVVVLAWRSAPGGPAMTVDRGWADGTCLNCQFGAASVTATARTLRARGSSSCQSELVDDEPRDADDRCQLSGEAGKRGRRRLWFDQALDDEASVGEGVEGRRQGAAPEALGDFNATLGPGVADQFGIEVAPSLTRQRQPEGMIERDDDPATGDQGVGEGGEWDAPILKVVERE